MQWENDFDTMKKIELDGKDIRVVDNFCIGNRRLRLKLKLTKI